MDIEENLSEREKEISVIVVCLERAYYAGIENEVVYSALEEMRFNNSITPAMAMRSACKEWDI